MLTLAICALALTPQAEYRKNISTFMDAERAFARMAALQGIRESFMHFFSPEGLAFNPEPHKAKEHYQAQPEEKKPLGYLLAWEPKIADCSGQADMGYTTGPARFIDMSETKKPISHMAYFSIWKKSSEGELKVVFDMGTPMAAAPVFPAKMAVRGAPKPALVTMDILDRAKSNLERFEDDIRKSTAAELPKTLVYLYNKEMIAYRPGSPPLQSMTEATAWHTANKLSLKEWEIKKTEVAGSADFAWMWGSYSGTLNEKPVKGYWAHVWKSEAGKGWHIVADVMNVIAVKE